jgi:hypothetical protein
VLSFGSLMVSNLAFLRFNSFLVSFNCFARADLTMWIGLASSKLLADFKGNATLEWEDQNDQWIGGWSHSKFSQGSDPQFGPIGIFDGEVLIVPQMDYPGFSKVTGGFSQSVDLSAFAYGTTTSAIKMVARSSTPEYAGFRLGFGGGGSRKGTLFTNSAHSKRRSA